MIASFHFVLPTKAYTSRTILWLKGSSGDSFISITLIMLLLTGIIGLLILCFLLAVKIFPSLAALTDRWTQSVLKELPSFRRSLSDPEVKFHQDVKDYRFPPLQERTSSRMAMGLKRLDESNWLTLDAKYLPEHELRCTALASPSRPKVIQCLEGSQAACDEVLEVVINFLTSRFPQHFVLRNTSTSPTIHNRLTDETYLIGSGCSNPLEVAAKLSMEDFNILMKHPNTGEYHLQASATLFPAGWKLQERIGTSMANLHAPVPQWKEKLGGSVDRYLSLFANLAFC